MTVRRPRARTPVARTDARARPPIAEIINDYASTDSERIEYLKSITMVSAHTHTPGLARLP